MVRIRDNDLAPAGREPDELRLYFMDPDLLICRSLLVPFCISEVQ